MKFNFSNRTICHVGDVARWRLCTGCGACSFFCKQKSITLQDKVYEGIRPIVDIKKCTKCGECLEVCPGLSVSREEFSLNEPCRSVMQNHDNWGPILGIWEGYAAEPEIRYRGSSGGAATAVALYCLKSGITERVLHVGKSDKDPLKNKTVVSCNDQELLSSAGSRYSPASPCDGLSGIDSSSSPYIFIGKPCDVQAVRKAAFIKDSLRRKIVAILGIFCAGTPATAGVLQLLSKLEVSPESVREIGFRGNGWPGYFSVKQLYGPGISRLSYEESWGFLQAFRPFRCFVCPDGTSEFADISFGDPWYRAIDEHELGRSLIIARSPLGVRIINSAEKAGYISIKEVGLQILEYSQYNLLMKRRAIWGRLLAMRLFGLPVPQYKGFSLHKSWSELDFAQKGISLIGTGRRILRRKLYHSVKWKC